MRIVIVDDEPLARSGLQARLAEHEDMQVVGQCGTGKAAVTAIRDLAPDLVFLDVQMPGLNGFDVLRKVPANSLPLVIFLTAYDHYALAAFEVNALDYLLKPIDDVRLAQALERARVQLKTASIPDIERRLRELLERVESKEARRQYETRFAVRTGLRIAIVLVEEIDWIEATGDYVTLHVGNRSHMLRQTMTRLEQQLDPECFIRIHRSVIVRASRICEMQSLPNREYLLRLTGGTTVKTSRRFSDLIERWL